MASMAKFTDANQCLNNLVVVVVVVVLVMTGLADANCEKDLSPKRG